MVARRKATATANTADARSRAVVREAQSHVAARSSDNSVAVVPAGVTRQVSYSGTPRGPDGLTQPDEYVRELADPIKRMEIFEEMRASDDAVQTAVEARRQEINAANWMLASEDETPLGIEILEFCEDNIYPLLDDLLRILGGGAITYGFAAIEPVFAWADEPFVAQISRGRLRRATRAGADRRIYLRKLAHIRQTSVMSFRISDTGDLESLLQHCYNGKQFRQIDIPAQKLLLWVYDKQGDDHWGVPPSRHCYKAWKFKTQIERLNLLHIDKFGVGTPVVEAGEGWTETERREVAGYVENWRSGATNFLMHPSGGSVDIKSDTGQGTAAALEWVKHYNLQVAKVFLTQQTELGSTETGARALGETFYEQLGGIVQADCEALASMINNQLIVPLVRWNFGPQEVYPTFAPSQRVRAGTGVPTVLQQLIASKSIHPRPEDEAWLRELFHMPPVELETLKAEQADRDAQAAEIARQQNANPGAPPAPKPPIKIAATRQLAKVDRAAGAPDPAPRGMTYRTREFATWEQAIVRPDVLARDLNIEAARLTGEVQDVLRDIDADLERQAKAAAAKGAAALSSAVRDIAVPERLRRRLRTVLLEAARRSRDYGAAAVRNEVRRQLDPEGIGPQRAPSLWTPTPEPPFYRRWFRAARALVQQGEQDQSARDLHLEAEVNRAAEQEIDRREESARSSILTALAQAASSAADELATIAALAVNAALIGLSTNRTESNVQSVVNVGFGIGRSDQADAINEVAAGGAGSGGRSGMIGADGRAIELVTKIYSAVMDLGTCDECAKWDGGHFPIDYPEDFTGVQAPNPRCEGSYAKCRCLWIYVTDQESTPSAPPSKGPQPLTARAA